MNDAPTTPYAASYIAAAQQGKHSWKRYLLGTLSIAFMWLIVGSVLTIVAAFAVLLALGDFTGEMIVALLTAPPPELIVPGFIVLMVSFIPFFLAVPGVVRLIHKRPARTVVTGAARINWRRMGFGFVLWGALMIAATLLDVVIRPNMYSFQFNLAHWLPYTLLALILIPIQAGSEELFFRGYLMQATSVFTRRPLLLMLPSALLFAGLHLANPEIQVNLPVVASFYLLFALFAAWISLKDGTIELALGMHIANNLTAVIVTFPESALPAPAPILKLVLEPVLDLTVFIAAALIFAFAAFGKGAFRLPRTDSGTVDKLAA